MDNKRRKGSKQQKYRIVDIKPEREMELTLKYLPFASSFSKLNDSKPKDQYRFKGYTHFVSSEKLVEKRKRVAVISCALVETAASIAVAATVVGAAATLLVRRTKASEETEVPLKTCEKCGGSGICPECKGEGFVLKNLSDKSAERARLLAKNAATRYTAGLPKKWSYCTKCSSARSCYSCGGSGKLPI